MWSEEWGVGRVEEGGEKGGSIIVCSKPGYPPVFRSLVFVARKLQTRPFLCVKKCPFFVNGQKGVDSRLYPFCPP